jgi:hypothetical protein
VAEDPRGDLGIFFSGDWNPALLEALIHIDNVGFTLDGVSAPTVYPALAVSRFRQVGRRFPLRCARLEIAGLFGACATWCFHY